MQYRRAYTKGGQYFFTLVTYKRRRLFSDDTNVDLLREVFRDIKEKRPFTIDAIVILPKHLHCIWSLPEGDDDFSTRWRLIKTKFTKLCDPRYKTHRNSSQIKKQQQGIWQNRFWEHRLRDDTDFEQHVHYIHYNPVRHGLVKQAVDWPYSSIHRFIERGIISCDWGGSEVFIPKDVGYE